MQAEQDRQESELGSAPRGGSWQRVKNDKRRSERPGGAGGARQRQRGIGNYVTQYDDDATLPQPFNIFFIFILFIPVLLPGAYS